MKKLTTQQKRNECMKLLKQGMRHTLWDPRLSTANTIEHELAKTKLLYYLKKDGKHAIAEAIFADGKGRADILVLDDFRVFEVLHSEKDKESLSKNDTYPFEIDIVRIHSDEILNKEFEL